MNLTLTVKRFNFEQVLCEHFQLSQFPTKKRKNCQVYVTKTNLGIKLPAGGRQGRTFLAEVPEIMELALAVEVHPAWPMDSLHHSCPHSALTLSLIWH